MITIAKYFSFKNKYNSLAVIILVVRSYDRDFFLEDW